MSSIDSSATLPARTASTSLPRHGLAGRPGISTSIPARALSSVERIAVQSETTTPSNPQRSFSTPVSSSRCSVMGVPLTLLYAAITAHAPAFTASSNGRRYSSSRASPPMRAS